MSLAFVTVEAADFDVIRQHLTNHMPEYGNMHLREACERDGERDLRYLHAMYAPVSIPILIEGKICGPGVYWHYQLTRTPDGTQLNVMAERGPERALTRIARRFTTEIIRRVQQEQAGLDYYPSRTPGQFYLRRSKPGAPATHRTCRRAVDEGFLVEEFVAQLEAWNLELLCP